MAPRTACGAVRDTKKRVRGASIHAPEHDQITQIVARYVRYMASRGDSISDELAAKYVFRFERVHLKHPFLLEQLLAASEADLFHDVDAVIRYGTNNGALDPGLWSAGRLTKKLPFYLATRGFT